MWIETYHRFASRAAFLAACDAAGWERDPMLASRPVPPPEIALDELGPLVAAATMDADGNPVAGDVLDARHHVNAAWHGGVVSAAFEASRIEPATPHRTFGIVAPPSLPPAVPRVIPAWKALAWLESAGKLSAAEAVALAAGPAAKWAWQRSYEWHRDSELMQALATGLHMTAEQIDAAFIAADAIEG